MSYLSFVLENARLLGFGFLLTLASSFGQTYFIALFGAEIRAGFGLTHGGFGALYALGTLVSGLTLVSLGRLADRVAPARLAALVVAGLAAAALGLALAPSALLLAPVIFLLRLTGQGMMTHIAITTMARRLPRERGKAISLASLGLPAGEAVLPVLAVLLLGLVGFRWSWVLFAALLLLVVLPLALWLPGGGVRRRQAPRPAASSAVAAVAERSWTRREVLRDVRFHLMLPGIVAPSFIVTGVLFHQVHLVEAKGWSLAWFASCFAGYAAATVVTSLVMGPMVDRRGARRLLHYHLPALAAALLLLGLFDHPLLALAFMLAAGGSSGANVTAINALWPELYGLGHLGAIRALAVASGVLASALAPVMLGAALDLGITIEGLLLACCAYAAICAVLLVAGSQRPA